MSVVLWLRILLDEFLLGGCFPLGVLILATGLPSIFLHCPAFISCAMFRDYHNSGSR